MLETCEHLYVLRFIVVAYRTTMQHLWSLSEGQPKRCTLVLLKFFSTVREANRKDIKEMQGLAKLSLRFLSESLSILCG